MTGPIEGLRVVDCSVGIAGPRATGMLADYGADVVWIEPPGGDPLRTRAPEHASVIDRGKRSVVLELAERAEVFVETWRPGVAEAHGLGYEVLHARNPQLVYVSISGFGEDSRIDLPAEEALVQAVLGGMSDQVAHRDGPVYLGFPFAAIGAAALAVIGALAALRRARDDGHGRHVQTSLLDGALAYDSMLWGESDATPARGDEPLPLQGTSRMRLITRSYECGDGEYLGIHTGAVGAFGRAMEVLGVADRVRPSADGMDMGMLLTDEELPVVRDEVVEIFRTRPRADWVRLFREADVCAVEHLRPTEVYDSPQARHNGMVLTVDDPVLGPVEQVAPPIRFSATPGAVRGAAPRVGEHEAATFADPTRSRAAPSSAPDTRPLLHGLKILDLGAYYAGPYSSRLLADLGADVIKLEPVAGDPLRGIERPFASAQAGKRSIAANLKDPDLGPAVRGLLAWADVVHHNQRPGAAERLGLDADAAHAVNPELVYLYAPGWGSTGPDMMRQSFAPMMSGYAGIGFECAGEYNPPIWPSGNEDPGNGLLGAVAVLMALHHRRRGGGGQVVENPQLNATMTHMAHAVRSADGTVVGARRLDPLQLGVGAFERLYETADGWVCIVAFDAEQRAALAALAGVDVGLGAGSDDEVDDYAVGLRLAEAFSARKTDEVLDELILAGVPAAVPAGHQISAFLRDPQQRRLGRVAEVHHPEQGAVRELAVLLRVSDADTVPHRLAPALGEHTDPLLHELGYGREQIEVLRARGVIR